MRAEYLAERREAQLDARASYGPTEAWTRCLVPSERCQVTVASPVASTATWAPSAFCPPVERVCTGLRVPAAERARAWSAGDQRAVLAFPGEHRVAVGVDGDLGDG